MTDDPTETTTKPAPGRGAYLPVLPDGWDYAIRITGPAGKAEIAPVYERNEDSVLAYRVDFASSDDTRSQTTETLAEACKIAASGVRALDGVAKAEQEFTRRRSDALSVLGMTPEERRKVAGAKVEPPADQSPSTAPSDD